MNVYINNVKCVLETGGLEVGMPLRLVDYNLYLVVDGHAAGCIFLEDFSHPIREPLILQLGLLLAVLLLVGEKTCEMYSCRNIFLKVFIIPTKCSFTNSL